MVARTMGRSTATKLFKLSPRESQRVLTKLDEVCRGEDGFAIYQEGWDDERVAKECLPEYEGPNAAKVVAKRRVAEFGSIRKPKPPAPLTRAEATGALMGRVNMLEAQMSQVIKFMKDMGCEMPLLAAIADAPPQAED